MSQPELQGLHAKEDEEDDAKGTVTLNVINTRNARSTDFKVQPKRLMSKVRERAYRRTSDQQRPGDAFEAASGYRLKDTDFDSTYEHVTRVGGPCPNERSFRIVGDAQGA